MILHRKLCVQTNRSRDLHYTQVYALFKVQVRYTSACQVEESPRNIIDQARAHMAMPALETIVTRSSSDPFPPWVAIHKCTYSRNHSHGPE